MITSCWLICPSVSGRRWHGRAGDSTPPVARKLLGPDGALNARVLHTDRSPIPILPYGSKLGVGNRLSYPGRTYVATTTSSTGCSCANTSANTEEDHVML